LVAGAADGLDAIVASGVFGGEFTAEAADVHVEAAIEGVELAAEDGFCEGLALDDFAGGTHEGFEEGELDVGEVDEGVVLADGAGGGV
jgi:uncharacterized protein involved in high-affinity Fe2+ transport